MNERIEAYDGANQEGQWVYDSQGVASDQGFGHVSKHWYPKTISYDQGMELLEAEQGHRQDYLVPVSELEFGIEDVDGKPRFVRQERNSFDNVCVVLGAPLERDSSLGFQ